MTKKELIEMLLKVQHQLIQEHQDRILLVQEIRSVKTEVREVKAEIGALSRLIAEVNIKITRPMMTMEDI